MSTIDSPDEVCATYAEGRPNLSLRLLDKDTVLIEGTTNALRFLSDLLAAQAGYTKDSGFQIGPTDAGSRLFAGGSLGIYIHRLDRSGA